MDQHANKRVNLDTVEWETERQAKTHPFRVKVTTSTIYNLETGEVVATAAPGYEFYYAHHRFHIQPVGLIESEPVPSTESIPTQVATPMGGNMSDFLGTMVVARMLPTLSALSKRES